MFPSSSHSPFKDDPNNWKTHPDYHETGEKAISAEGFLLAHLQLVSHPEPDGRVHHANVGLRQAFLKVIHTHGVHSLPCMWSQQDKVAITLRLSKLSPYIRKIGFKMYIYNLHVTQMSAGSLYSKNYRWRMGCKRMGVFSRKCFSFLKQIFAVWIIC